MENKLQNYQSKIKFVNQENEGLKDCLAKLQKNDAESQEEKKKSKKRLRYSPSTPETELIFLFFFFL